MKTLQRRRNKLNRRELLIEQQGARLARCSSQQQQQAQAAPIAAHSQPARQPLVHQAAPVGYVQRKRQAMRQKQLEVLSGLKTARTYL